MIATCRSVLRREASEVDVRRIAVLDDYAGAIRRLGVDEPCDHAVKTDRDTATIEAGWVDRLRDADAVVASLPPGSLVANATGAGKDIPGSPLTDAVVFPRRGVAWEFNYRGDLVFLAQARAQATERELLVADGWT